MGIVDLSATKDCHCLAARKRAREITRLYEEKLRPRGLRATQFSILAALVLKGPMPLGEFADLLGLERTSLTRRVNRLGHVLPRGIPFEFARRFRWKATNFT